MFTQTGISAMTGIAIQQAYVLPENIDYSIRRRHVAPEEAEQEIQRVRKAITHAVEEIDGEIETLEVHSGLGAKILEFHKVLLSSPDLAEETAELIRQKNMSAEYACYTVLQRWHEHFAGLKNKRANQKYGDLLDVERKLLGQLGVSQFGALQDIKSEVVVIAHNLTPSQTVALFHSKVRGFATDIGGNTAHTAIMARSLMIPAVVGTGDLSERLVGGETIIIDGNRGVVIVEPDEETLKEYRAAEKRHQRAFGSLMAERDFPAETLDGYDIEIMANIELAEEVDLAIKMGAVGIGLYRTEFLYEEHFDPSESLQVSAYEEVVTKMKGRTCVIRTMDLGADKLMPDSDGAKEPNPFLGERSIRYSMANPDLFMIQLRAILRASVRGPVQLLLPMISSVDEIRRAKECVAAVKDSLRKEGVPFAQDIPLGIMVEVPSAALSADQMAREVDFFSIGTNDLVQYTLAVDRVNEKVAHLYQPGSPAVLKLLQMVFQAGQRHNLKVSLCGEMAAEPRFAVLLLGLGLRSFSVAPVVIPTIKHLVRSVSLSEAEAIAEKALTFSSSEECNLFLSDRVKSLLPHVV